MMRVPLFGILSGALFMLPLAPSATPAPPALTAPVDRVATEIAGSSFVHEIQKGDTLTSLAARHGLDAAVLARRNGLAPRTSLVSRIGERLIVDNRHIVWPVDPASGTMLIVNVPQRMLFRVVDGRAASAYPVAVGRTTWPTPLGPFTVIEKEVDPTWDVPKSIQEEMRREGKPVVTSIPPCPANPLGRHWLRLSHPGVGVHGTNVPTSIYGFTTHGCIRLHPDDVESLFEAVQVGDAGVVVYDPVLLARTAEGRLFVEVQPDPYRQGPDPLRHFQSLAEKAGIPGIAAEIDWDRVREAVRRREGLAVDITRERATQ